MAPQSQAQWRHGVKLNGATESSSMTPRSRSPSMTPHTVVKLNDTTVLSSMTPRSQAQ